MGAIKASYELPQLLLHVIIDFQNVSVNHILTKVHVEWPIINSGAPQVMPLVWFAAFASYRDLAVLPP